MKKFDFTIKLKRTSRSKAIVKVLEAIEELDGTYSDSILANAFAMYVGKLAWRKSKDDRKDFLREFIECAEEQMNRPDSEDDDTDLCECNLCIVRRGPDNNRSEKKSDSEKMDNIFDFLDMMRKKILDDKE